MKRYHKFPLDKRKVVIDFEVNYPNCLGIAGQKGININLSFSISEQYLECMDLYKIVSQGSISKI